MSEKEISAERNKYSKNDGKKRNKIITGILGLAFNITGIHRFFMGKFDFFRYGLLMFILAGVFVECKIDAFDELIITIPGFIVYAESLSYLCMSNRRFNMLCQARKLRTELKIYFMPYDKLEAYADEIGMVIDNLLIEKDMKIDEDKKFESELKKITEASKESTIHIEVIDNTHPFTKQNDTVSNNYYNNGIDGSNINDHEHIKEDNYLKQSINEAQDRLDAYKSNDYFPDVNQPLRDSDREQVIKELKDELNSGLITKEEYDNKMNNL